MPSGGSRRRVLITGAAGLIGKEVAPRLRGRFALRLLDRQAPAGEGDDEVVTADVLDEAAMRRACRGVDAVVHLAGIPGEADFDSLLLPLNIQAVQRVFEAARLEGVRRVIFASSIQAVLGYPTDVFVTAEMPVRPISAYASTKVFGEALARFYSDEYGMSMICLRIGAFRPYGSPHIGREDTRRIWVSPGDMAHMLECCLESDVAFAVLFAVSRNAGLSVDIESAASLVGYRPCDDAATAEPGDAAITAR